MALWTYSFLTVAVAKRHLGMNSVDTTKDTLLEELIDATCRAIEDHLGRYVLQRTSITEYYDGDGSDFLYLRNSPATVTSVYEDANREFAAETLLDGTGTDADYLVATEDDITRIELLGMKWQRAKRSIKVVYDGGWTLSTIPFPILEAARLTVQTAYDLSGGGKGLLGKASVSAAAAGSAGLQPEFVTLAPSMIPRQAKRLLDSYRNNLGVL